ncbi:MAG: hypothetical protein ABIG94_02155 [Pseudomonadota bacterium]
MGLLRRILGWEKKQDKPYVDAGMAVMHKLITKFNLLDWKDLLPSYTDEEIEAINKRWSRFQRMANNVGGGDVKFHPEILPDLKRMLVGEALAELAGDSWKFSDQLPTNWKECISTYLKAWASYLDPLSLLDLGELLTRAGYLIEAKEVFQVVLLFPTYANTYYAGQQKPELVKSIVDSAKESLKDLN